MSRSLFARLHQRYGPRIDGATRREFLKTSLAVGTGLLLSSRFGFAKETRSGKRVVVIGAGFSGLACAHELMSVGYDVTVIDARDRVGGRVLSFGDFVKGKNVEGGGELIGSNHPTWVAYADKFGLKFLDVSESEDEAPLVINGKKLDAKEGKELYDAMDEALAKMNEDASKIDEDQPWTSAGADALDKKTTQQWLDALDAPPLLKAAVTVELEANNGQKLDKQSYLGNLTQVKGGGVEKYWTDSEVYRCNGGNQQLAHKLAEAIGKDRIILGLPVSQINGQRDAMVVTCRDGRTIEVDDVVLATPPSTWKKITFEPGLPRALDPQMGFNVKYLSNVKSRFWKEAKLAADSLGDGDVCMTWEATDGQDGDEGACLTAFSGGPAAESARSRSRAERDKAYAAELEKLYPNFSKNFVEARFMDWPADPWTNASYSFPAPGQVTTVGPLMYKGLGRLHFAGEHTCYKFVGYMEGGLNSGATIARRIATRDGIKIEPPASAPTTKPAPAKEPVAVPQG